MSQRGVQLMIGGRVTDSVFRRPVESGGSACLAGLRSQGVELTRMEVAALSEMDPHTWATGATNIDDLGLTRNRARFEDDGSRVHGGLTAQQQQVLTGICESLRNNDFAARLGISEVAVTATTVQELFRKQPLRRRVQLIRVALDEHSWRANRSRAVRHAKSNLRAHRLSRAVVARAS